MLRSRAELPWRPSWRGGTGFSVSASSSRGRQHEADDTWQTRTAPAARRIDPRRRGRSPLLRTVRTSLVLRRTDSAGPPSVYPAPQGVHPLQPLPVHAVQHQPSPNQGRRTRGGAGLLIAAVLLALVVGGAAGFGGARLAAWTATPAPASSTSPTDRPIRHRPIRHRPIRHRPIRHRPDPATRRRARLRPPARSIPLRPRPPRLPIRTGRGRSTPSPWHGTYSPERS